MREELRKLLNDVAFELQKSGNEDATNLIDRIDRVLHPIKIARVLKVSDFFDEFIEKLREQLENDHKRWGNTWLNRSKQGQELRTKARYLDYFDMFEQAGIPVPWMKVIGGALICWIREQHPELCPDISIVEEAELLVERKLKKGSKYSEEVDIQEKIKSILNQFLFEPNDEVSRSQIAEWVLGCIKDNLPDKKKIHTVTVICDETNNDAQIISSGRLIVDYSFELRGRKRYFRGAVDGEEGVRFIEYIKDESCICKDVDMTIRLLGHDGSCVVEKPVEDMTTKELVESGHKSDCAVYNESALPKSECNCQDCNLPDINDINDMTTKELLESGHRSDCKLAHVINERIRDMHRGKLGYSPHGSSSRIILTSIKFTKGIGPEAVVLARCDKKGILIPHSRQIGIIGTVFIGGNYQFKAIRGVTPADKVYVSYDYEYEVGLDI